MSAPHRRDDSEDFAALVGPRLVREARVRNQLARLVEQGRDFVILLAIEHPSHGNVHCKNSADDENPPFVQFAWRDDLRLQIETQGDHYRDVPYVVTQHRLLGNLGYHSPFELGDEFPNWTCLREGEGCHPQSVASFMLHTLSLVHGVHFETAADARRVGVSHWTTLIRATSTTRDIKAEILRRYRPA